MLTRRAALISLLSTTALAGCGGVTPSPAPAPGPLPGPSPLVPSWLMDDVNLVFTDVSGIVGQLGNILGVQTVTTIQGYLTVAQDLVRRIASSTSSGDLSGNLSAFVNAIRAALGALSAGGVALPGWVGVVVNAVQLLLPVILSVVGAAAMTAAARRPDSAAVARARATLVRFRDTGRP